MSSTLHVHLLPALFEPAELRGGVAVVLDILRASTTIIHALAAGADCVIPTEEIDEALAVKTTLPAGACLLGGERAGLLIPGFDLDNNPFAYADNVRGKMIVFTTTNGTRALKRADQADRVLIGGFVNLAAVVDVLRKEQRPIHLVCAGTMGQVTQEDALCAGAIVDGLLAAWNLRAEDLPDDQAQLALHRYLATETESGLLRAMRNSYGGRNCRRLGFDDQIARVATVDLFRVVPEYDAVANRIAIRNSPPLSRDASLRAERSARALRSAKPPRRG
jgi:2-phosphosulfolactate phosphatase